MSYEEKRRERRRERNESEFRQIVMEKGGILLSKYEKAYKEVLIQCGRGHKWKSMPSNVKNRGYWCPHCYRKKYHHKKEQTFQDSLAMRGYILLSEYVDNKTEVLIQCVEGHTWKVTPDSIKRGSWCPYCHYMKKQKAARKAPLPHKIVSQRARRTPATLEELQQLGRDKGGAYLTPHAVKSHIKALWRCAKGHKWEATPGNVRNHGSWCPHCRNKSENAVRTMLKYALGLDFPPFSRKALERLGIELRNTAGNQMTLDGFCLDIVCAFEFHGDQHTNPTSRFYVMRGSGSFQRRQEDDRLKREQCESAGIVLFEIYEEQHGAWPHLTQLYSGLLDVLEENGVNVTGKPNQSDSAWMQLISYDGQQSKLF